MQIFFHEKIDPPLSPNLFFRILHSISFTMTSIFLWFSLKRRAYERFPGRHPRRSTATTLTAQWRFGVELNIAVRSLTQALCLLAL